MHKRKFHIFKNISSLEVTEWNGLLSDKKQTSHEKKLQLFSLSIFLFASCQKNMKNYPVQYRHNSWLPLQTIAPQKGWLKKYSMIAESSGSTIFNYRRISSWFHLSTADGFPWQRQWRQKQGLRLERKNRCVDRWNRFIAVYGRAYNDMTWFIDSTCLENVDEECYVQNIRNQMTSLYKIDTQHIYWMGTSNGGGLCLDLSVKFIGSAQSLRSRAIPGVNWVLKTSLSYHYSRFMEPLDGTITMALNLVPWLCPCRFRMPAMGLSQRLPHRPIM